METWSEVSEKFSHVTDRLGKPIDPGIFDTVVALNMLQIQTSQSCEGHSNRGLAYPWVDVEALASRQLRQKEPPEIQALQRQFTTMRKQIEQNETPQEREAKQQAKQADLAQRYALHQLLAEFYAGHPTPYDRIITFSLSGRIRSQGGDFLDLLSLDERMQKLRAYQDEMAAFTTFLKSRILPELMR